MSNPAWTLDPEGHRVMLGLTADETAEYQSLLNVSAGVSCEEMQARLAFLHRQHEAALRRDGVEPEAAGEGMNGP